MKEKIKKLLADFLGVDTEDIKDADSLTVDLHMSSSDLTDFLASLSQEGIDADDIDMTEIDTFEELVEKIYDKHPNP